MSAAARCDYIDRAGRYGSDHEEVLHKGHGNMPAWAENYPKIYWEAADIHERANGRLFKQLEFALPRELSPEQQTELVTSFCRDLAQTKDGPLPYSFAIHKGHDRENPHCHLMISERVNDGHCRTPGTWFKRAAKDPAQGGAKKTNELRPREWLLHCRELWSERANNALELAGHTARIDHRTLEAQGIEREPTVHLGPTIAALERQGIRTTRGNQNRRREHESVEAIKEKWAKKIEELRAKNILRKNLFSLVKLARTNEAEELAQARRELALKQNGGKENAYTTLLDIQARYAAEAKEIQENSRLTPSSKTGLLAILKMRQLADEDALEGKVSPLAGVKGEIDDKGHVMFNLAGGGLVRDAGMVITFSAGDQAAQDAALRYGQAKWGKNATLGEDKVYRAPTIAKVQHPSQIATEEKKTAPVPPSVPTPEEYKAELLAIAKQGPPKMEHCYHAQIKPYEEYIAAAEDKSTAFAFCKERMQADISTDAPALKAMEQALLNQLKGCGWSWSKQGAFVTQLMGNIRVAPDRAKAFDAFKQELGLSIGRDRGLE